MLNWLKKCVKESQEFDAASSDFSQKTCEYESSTGDCNLIQQLKEKQSIKKTIDNDIRAYEQYDSFMIQYTYKFLMALSNRGLRWFDHEKFLRYCEYCSMVKIVDDALWDISIEDIDNLANELKVLKQRRLILQEKKSALKAIETDVDNIKTKLGIE